MYPFNQDPQIPDQLFADDFLSRVNKRKCDDFDKARFLSDEDIETTSEDDLVNRLVRDDLFGSVAIEFASIHRGDSQPHNNGYHLVHLEVPVSGNIQLINYRPQTGMPYSPIRGKIQSGNSSVRLSIIGKDTADIEEQVNQWTDMVRGIVDKLNIEAKEYDAKLITVCRLQVAAKIDSVKRHKQVVDSLPYPMKRRANPPQALAVPIQRRQTINIIQANSSRAKKGEIEYVVTEEEYKYILRVLQDMGRVFECNPETSSKLHEPDLRNILLVALNSHYEGKATGETFNGDGKTDILIKHESTNVFVAECKIWRGRSEFTTALDQLLGYITWRDTKTALIIFIRDSSFTDILNKIDGVVRSHKNYKRTHSDLSSSSKRYVFTHPKDLNQQFDLAVLCLVTVQNKS